MKIKVISSFGLIVLAPLLIAAGAQASSLVCRPNFDYGSSKGLDLSNITLSADPTGPCPDRISVYEKTSGSFVVMRVVRVRPAGGPSPSSTCSYQSDAGSNSYAVACTYNPPGSPDYGK